MPSDLEIDFAANKIWEATGGALIDHAGKAIGADIGADIGFYIGGAIGGAIGFFCPAAEIPLVEGGEFLGERLGAYLGGKAGKTAADVTNKFIEKKVIDPSAEHVFKAGFENVMAQKSPTLKNSGY